MIFSLLGVLVMKQMQMMNGQTKVQGQSREDVLLLLQSYQREFHIYTVCIKGNQNVKRRVVASTFVVCDVRLGNGEQETRFSAVKTPAFVQHCAREFGTND